MLAQHSSECLYNTSDVEPPAGDAQSLLVVKLQVRRDLQQFGIYRALPVHGEPDFASGPPTSAEEYLRRVRSALHTLAVAATLSLHEPSSIDR